VKVVLDTNVVLSAVLGGRTAQVLDLWRARAFDVIVTTDIFHEYLSVLRRPKFKLSADIVDDIAAYFWRNAVLVTPADRIAVVLNDPRDDMFLEAAVTGEVGYIVSGDEHLLNLGVFRGVPIVTVHDFLDALKSQGT
jgi:putative PIN family toxin of toxin-antitoxin system